MTKEQSIIFYGKDFTPLSNECYGCYHYGTICGGSVYESECRAGIVTNIAPSIVASLVLRFTNNRFTLARVFGYDLERDVKESDLLTDDLKTQFAEALQTPEETIELYKKMYSLDIHGTSEIVDYYPNDFSEPSSEPISDSSAESSIDTDPFKSMNTPIEISDDDLPF